MPARLQVFELQLKAESSNTCTIPGASFGKGSIEALSSLPCLSPSHAFGQAPDPRKGRPHSQQDATPPRHHLLPGTGAKSHTAAGTTASLPASAGPHVLLGLRRPASPSPGPASSPMFSGSPMPQIFFSSWGAPAPGQSLSVGSIRW